jgi:hypothetical protein
VENLVSQYIFFRVLLIVIGLTGLIASNAAGQETNERDGSALQSDFPSLAALKDCLNSVQSAECLDLLFREALRDQTTLQALHRIDRLEAEDPELRRDCHPVVHSIGRETFRLKGNIHDSFNACDQTCHSGCYHGSVERFLRGDDIYTVTRHPSQNELKQKATAACDPNTPLRIRFQCLHGLGHALMFFANYELQQSLSVCDIFPDEWSQSSCYGGVFMENVFNAANEKKNFKDEDLHYPCNRLDSKYRSECYMMQTSHMSEAGLSPEEMLAECARAGDYAIQCTQSIGRDLSNVARIGKPRDASSQCELAEGERRLACMRGVIYALIDNAWDGRYAMPFCTTFAAEKDSERCVSESIAYLKSVFEKSAEDILKECKTYTNDSKRCVDLAATSSEIFSRQGAKTQSSE